MPTLRRPRRPAPARLALPPIGPYRGMRDSLDPTATDIALASLLQNVYPAGPGANVVGRPGCRQLGAAGVPLAGRGQGVQQFTRLDGTTYTVVVAGGAFYTVDWTTRTLTETLTAAQLATASVTLSSTARVALVPFNQGSDYQLVVSDGVNTPWLWDGTAGGGITKLVNCPPLFGVPTVYYGKLFGIKASDHTVMVWSNEADATTGYEQAQYLYNWQLRQSDARPLTRLFGTNEVLYVFRARSITSVQGRVTPDFQTFGTRDGVSETVGTVSPWAVATVDQLLLFLDADGHPQCLPIGGDVLGTDGAGQPIWTDLRETTSMLAGGDLAQASACYDPTVGLVKFAVCAATQTEAALTLCYAAWQFPPQAAALFRGYTAAEMAVCRDASGQPVFVHLSPDGYAYDHGTARGSVWDDGLAAGTQPVAHALTSPYLAADTATETIFERVDVACRTTTNMTSCSVQAETPYGTTPPLLVSFRGNLALWGQFRWGQNWSAASVEIHGAWGVSARGRWLRVHLQHAQRGEQFGFGTMTVRGRSIDSEPTAT